jgi:hypothetical protein
VSDPDTNRLLAELSETEKIRRLLFDCAYHMDMNHPGEVAALFTEDCSIAYAPGRTLDGRAAWLETMTTTVDGVNTFFAATSHHISNIVVNFGADLLTAKVRSIVYAWHRYTEPRPNAHFYGQYHDDVVLTPDGWKIHRRELRATGVVDFHSSKQIPIGRAGPPTSFGESRPTR